MFNSFEDNEKTNCSCISRCCMRYNIVLSILSTLILLLLGLIIGSEFSAIFTNFTSVLIAVIAGLLLLAVMVYIIRGCCKKNIIE